MIMGSRQQANAKAKLQETHFKIMLYLSPQTRHEERLKCIEMFLLSWKTVFIVYVEEKFSGKRHVSHHFYAIVREVSHYSP